MKKFFKALLLFSVFLQTTVSYLFVTPAQVFAAPSCNDGFKIITIEEKNFPPNRDFIKGADYDASFKLQIGYNGATQTGTYKVQAWVENLPIDSTYGTPHSFQMNAGDTTSAEIPFEAGWYDANARPDMYLNLVFPDNTECTILYYDTVDNQLESCQATAYVVYNGQKCNGCFEANTSYTIEVTEAKNSLGEPYNGRYDIKWSENPTDVTVNNELVDGSGTSVATTDGPGAPAFTIKIKRPHSLLDSHVACSVTVPPVQPAGSCDYANQCSYEDEPETPPAVAVPYKLCNQINQNTPEGQEAYTACLACAGDEVDAGGVWTAFGCISRSPESIIERLITVGLGMGGGVALLMFLAGGFILTTSQGEPKRVSDAKEMITSSVIGLVFVIFSVTILQFIGVTILRIPGFGG